MSTTSRNFFLSLSLLLLLGACSTSQKTAQTPVVDYEERQLDTLFVEAEKPSALKKPEEYQLPRYNASSARVNDLLHTRLELRFNWQEEAVIGQATLKLKPYFYPTRTLTLDAKGFTFSKVTLAGSQQALPYKYDGQQIVIDLGRTYSRQEEYSVTLQYVAHPAADGGSAAITSNQGLFFINPRGEDGDKPQQIWTQGETEWNSRWFPTIDKPNERATSEIQLTVEDRFVTLSNGRLVSTTRNADGTRTDLWRMDQPHAPYLNMIAIGEFAVIKDKWRTIDVDYYVEPAFADYAKAIFPHTPEMLEFFSEKLNYPYPWSKYAQVVVRDYVSGAMENTTAVIFGEFMQGTPRELIDNLGNEKVVAHEMFHHWFGDLVTTESWANLTLNEGFANYSEYLWLEHQYGRETADHHLDGEWQGYLASSGSGMHPLINYGYEENEQMFDAHSYNKGGSILHMLRNLVGDEAFFASLNRYLNRNAYQSVEADNLRLAFEEVTGQDLHWFFNQWFFNQGHPELNITYGYDAAKGEATLQVEQTQNPDRMPAIFQLPVAVDLYVNGQRLRQEITVDKRVQTFRFPVASQPTLMTFDADRMLLAEITDNKTDQQLLFQYQNGPKFLDRYEALSRLLAQGSPRAQEIAELAFKDPFWAIRNLAVDAFSENAPIAVIQTLRTLAMSDPHSAVRANAFAQLASLNDPQTLAIAKQAIERDSAYQVIGAALQSINEIDPASGQQYARMLENEKSTALLSAIAEIYAGSGSGEHLPFFRKNLSRVDGYDAIAFYQSYATLAVAVGDPNAASVVQDFNQIALTLKESLWRRFSAMAALNDMRNAYRQQANQAKDPNAKIKLEAKVSEISRIMDAVKATESNPELQMVYQQLQLLERA